METAKTEPDNSYFFLCGVPLLNSALVREKLGYFDELNRLKSMLGAIPFSLIPIFGPQTAYMSTRRSFSMMHGISHFFLARKLRALKPDIVHARSYHAAYAVAKVREKHGLDYRIIFDLRGFWPEETAWKRRSQQDCEDYLFLKKIEQYALAECDACVSVSDPMQAAVPVADKSKSHLIYLSTDAGRLVEVGRKRAPPESNTARSLTFCYVGALTKDTWHNPDAILRLYHHFSDIGLKARFRIVTTSDHRALREELSEIPDDKLDILSTRSTEELARALEDVDIGLLPYREGTEHFEQLVGNTILGTKTVEYLAAGIPVLVNENCGGAAAIVKKYGVGLCYNLNAMEALDKQAICQMLTDIDRERLFTLTLEQFDYASNARKYQLLYSRLVDQPPDGS